MIALLREFTSSFLFLGQISALIGLLIVTHSSGGYPVGKD